MDLHQLLQAQAGVVTYEQLVAAGLPLRWTRAGGPLVRLRQGVYAERARVEDADPAAGTALAVAAARLTTGVDLVAVGDTAALLHGLPLLGAPPVEPRLVERKELRPQHHGSSRRVVEAEVELHRGVPVVDVARACVDVARRRGFVAGVVTADAALARGLDRAALEAALPSCTGWPGVRAARRVVAFADGRAETPLESLGRARFDEDGLPPCDLQVVLGDATGPIARVDHYWERYRTVAEADGALKYASPADLFAEKLREDRLREAGFEVVRYTWDEVLRRPTVVAARLRTAFRRASARRAA